MTASHRPARRAEARLEAWLVAVCLGLAAGFEQGRAADSAPGAATNLPPLGTVLGVQRLADRDVLFLRDGDRLAGTLTNPTFELRTVYGRLQLPAGRVAAIELGATAERLDVVVAVNRDQFSGFLDTQPFAFTLATGGLTNVRPERVLKLVRRVADNEVEGVPRRQFLLMRNGDHFTGKALGDRTQLVVGRADQSLSTVAMQSIQFPRERQPATRIVMRSGEVMQGTWPVEDLDVDLDLGLKLRIHQSHIDVLYCREGFVPSKFAITSAGSSTGLETPPGPAEAPGGRSLPGMRWISPGQFMMGSPAEETGRDLDEGPQTQVTITRGFWIGVCEVTQTEYKAVMGANPSQFLEGLQLPVEKVSWREAADYCERLTRLQAADGSLPAGYAYRLPTEAEWEYACRAGTTSRFSHGDDPDGRQLEEFAWFGNNAESMTHPVRTKKPNPWGLHDMHGNVMEWCLDAATSSLPGGKLTDYAAPDKGPLRVARGGSWLYGPKFCRSANRDTYTETTRCSDLGFRVVLASAIGKP